MSMSSSDMCVHWLRINKWTLLCLAVALSFAAVFIAFIVVTSMGLSSTIRLANFVAITTNATTRLENIFSQSELQLEILTSLIALTDVDNRTFSQFLADLPSITSIDASFALGWCPYVLASDVLQHEQLIRAEVCVTNAFVVDAQTTPCRPIMNLIGITTPFFRTRD
jgi:hypothetical protein